MADNTTLPSGSGGDTMRTKEKAGAKTQVILLDLGGDGAESLLASGNPMPVSDAGGSLTVDAAVGSPVFVRLSDGTAAISTLPVSLASVPSHAVTNAGTFAVQASQAGTWAARVQDGAGNALTSKAPGSERALSVAIVDGSGNQVTSFGGSGGTSATDDAAFTVASGAGTPIMGVVTSDSVDSGDVGVVGMLANRQLKVTLYNSSGSELSVGGGTQYDEDAASAGAEKLTLAGAVRRDTAASSSTTDGDYSTLNTDASGRLWVNGSGVTQPVSGTVGVSGSVAVTGTFWQATQPVSGTVAATQSGTWDVGTVTTVTTLGTITNVVHVDDNAGSLTVDAPVGTPVFVRLSDGTSAITTLPVSLASVPSHAVTNAGTFAVQAAQSGTWDVATVTTVSTVTAVTTVSTVTAVSDAQVQGKAAHDAAVSGNPVLNGIEGRRARATAVSADGDATRLTGDRYGRLAVVGVPLTIAAVDATASGDTDVVAAASIGAGNRCKLLRVEASNTHASTALTVGLKSASLNGGTVFGKKYLPAAGGLAVWVFPNGYLEGGDNEAVQINLSGAGTVSVTAYYELVAS